jgi:hypothetical protein
LLEKIAVTSIKVVIGKTSFLEPLETTMIPDEIGQKLHDRATRGEMLTEEEQGLLQGWYARRDQDEMAQLSTAPVPTLLTDLQSRAQQATAQVVAQAQRIEALTVENAELRQEIATLQRLLSAKLADQPA